MGRQRGVLVDWLLVQSTYLEVLYQKNIGTVIVQKTSVGLLPLPLALKGSLLLGGTNKSDLHWSWKDWGNIIHFFNSFSKKDEHRTKSKLKTCMHLLFVPTKDILERRDVLVNVAT